MSQQVCCSFSSGLLSFEPDSYFSYLSHNWLMWKGSGNSNGIQEAVISVLVCGRDVSPNRTSNMTCFSVFLRSACVSLELLAHFTILWTSDFTDKNVNIFCFLIKTLNVHPSWRVVLKDFPASVTCKLLLFIKVFIHLK